MIWALQHDEWASAFDQVIELEEGRLVRSGAAAPAPRAPDAEQAKLVTAE